MDKILFTAIKKFQSVLLMSMCMVFVGFGQNAADKELKKTIHIGKKSARQLLHIADSLARTKDVLEAENYYQMAFDLSRSTGEKEDIIEAGFQLSQFLSTTLEKHEQSEKIIDFLLGYCTEQRDNDCAVLAAIRYGELYIRMFRFIDALKYFNRALQQAENIENKDLHWRAWTARGLLLLNIGEGLQARKDFKKALTYATDQASSNNRSMAYVNLSASFGEQVPDSTIYYSRLAAKACIDDKTSRRCNLAYNNMAWAYFLKGMPKEALDIINTHIDLENIEYSFRDSLYPALMHTLGSIYYELEEYQKAIDYFKIAHTYFQKENDVAYLVLVKEDLSKTYEKIGDLRASIDILREVKPLTSKLDQLKITQEIARVESKKLLEIKDEQILTLEEENSRIGREINKSKVFSYFLGFFLLIALAVLLYKGHKNKVRFHQLNEELSLSRLKSLRSMMNPHFLFNSFSTLQNYILKKDNLKANEYMTELSGLIRNVLSSSDSIYITFKEELQILTSYIRIEQGRFSENFDVTYDVDEQLVETNPTIPSMIIQPHIENAIIHGFSHADKKGLLTLSFYKEAHALICKVQDNGIGRDEAERLKKIGNDTIHLSIATRNTNERLRILSRINKDKAHVEIHDLFYDHGKPKGTEVIITLPILNRKYE